MLHRMALHLSGKVVALYLDNSTAKAYLCNQGGTVSPFLSRLACQILSVTATSMVLLLFAACIPTHLNVEADCLSQGWILQEWHLLPQVTQAASTPLGSTRGCICWHPPVPPNASFITPLNLHYTLGALGLNAFGHPWMFQVSYVFPPAHISFSSSVQVSGRTYLRSTQTFDPGGTMLDGGSFASDSSQHVWQMFLSSVPS